MFELGFWGSFPAVKTYYLSEVVPAKKNAWRRKHINPRWTDLIGQRKLDGIRTSPWLMRHISPQVHEPQDVRVLEHLRCGITTPQFIQPFSTTELRVAEERGAEGQGLKTARYRCLGMHNAKTERF